MGAVLKLGTITMKTFVEIGSCDFDTLNYLGDEGWRGVIVEPIKERFDNLAKLANVTYLNVACAKEFGKATIWKFKDEEIAKDYDLAGMTSFRPEVFSSANVEETKSRMEPREVLTMTYSNILDVAGIDRVDFLKIDTEGYDWIILQMVDFEGPRRPKFIKLEHAHIDDILASEFLEDHGYHIDVQARDIFALDLKQS